MILSLTIHSPEDEDLFGKEISTLHSFIGGLSTRDCETCSASSSQSRGLTISCPNIPIAGGTSSPPRQQQLILLLIRLTRITLLLIHRIILSTCQSTAKYLAMNGYAKSVFHRLLIVQRSLKVFRPARTDRSLPGSRSTNLSSTSYRLLRVQSQFPRLLSLSSSQSTGLSSISCRLLRVQSQSPHFSASSITIKNYSPSV